MSSANVVGPGDGRQFATPFGTLAAVKVDVGEADFAIFESGPPAQHGQPPHVHDVYDEAFYIMSGTLLFRLGDDELEAGPGTTVFAPRGSVHGFANHTDQPARMLVIATPAAVSLVESLGRVMAKSPPDPASIAGLFAAHQSRLAPPGPLSRTPNPSGER